MVKDKKILLPAALAAVLLIVALVAAARGSFGTRPDAPPPPPAADTAVPAAKTAQPAGIVRAGTVAKPVALPVTSGYSGRIDELYVTEGQAVKAGQPLYKMAGPPPDQSNYETARKDYERLQALYQKGAIPRKQVEAAAARLETARQSGGSGAPATIAAPVDGIVGDLAAAPGGVVQAGQQILALGSGQKLAVVVPLRQNELNAVPLGAPVTVEAAGQTVKGRVTSIYPEAEGGKVPLFLAHIKLAEPPDGLLQTGLPVTVRIATGP